MSNETLNPFNTAWPTPTPRELALAACATTLVLLALVLPSIPQWPSYHDFADQRTLFAIPHAMDVLSNLPFALLGVWGLRKVATSSTADARGAMFIRCATLFFAGLLLTAFGSSWYHLAPSDDGLLIDRACIVVAFAAVLGMLAAQMVSARAASWLVIGVLSAGMCSVGWWRLHNDLAPYALVQFGGMAMVSGLAMLKPTAQSGRTIPHVRWLVLIVAYGVAKLFELGDNAIFELSHHVVSGHTLKHLAAAAAAWPVLAALREQERHLVA